MSDIVHLSRRHTSSETAEATQQFLVLSTGNAKDGLIRPTDPPCDGSAIGSAKKMLRPGQVIVSRLRPYLRQVAWVDGGLLDSVGKHVSLVCSSEFHVLESKDGLSIAFLVPFLLCERVQAVLSASQEGGHHPRFNERALKSLPVPTLLLEQRDGLSGRVEAAVTQARNAFCEIHGSVGVVDSLVDDA